MATTPAVKASTQIKTKDTEATQLMAAMAAAMQAGEAGRNQLDSIDKKLRAKDKEQHTKDMKRFKK